MLALSRRLAKNPDIATMERFAQSLAAIPLGTSTGRAEGRRYMATKTRFNGGRSIKLAAEELGGSDYISLNFFDLKSGAHLAPCEMSAQKVIRFVMVYRPLHLRA